MVLVPSRSDAPADAPVGVLALQGDFAEHCAALGACGLPTREVRTARDLEGLSGLVLPGGESTTMLRLLGLEGLEEPLRAWLRRAAAEDIPVLGTCAGLILLAEGVHSPSGKATQRSFAVLPVDVDRNGYGRQVHSGRFPLLASHKLTAALRDSGGDPAAEAAPLFGVFIRAPRITAVRGDVEVLAWRELPDGSRDPVLVRRGSMLGAGFHPELERDHPVVSLFAAQVQARVSGQRGAGRISHPV